MTGETAYLQPVASILAANPALHREILPLLNLGQAVS
jgi:hypothetical protein